MLGAGGLRGRVGGGGAEQCAAPPSHRFVCGRGGY